MTIQAGSPVDLHSASTVGGQAFWHAGNFTPGNYLLLTGGTINGNLTANGPATFNATNTERYAPISGYNSSQLTPANTGVRSLLWNAIGASKPINLDEEFVYGTNNVTVYNNGTGGITVTREADATAPNKSGYRVKVAYDGTGAPSPGLGGFYQSYTARANAVIVQRFIAKLPVGYSFVNAENSMGTNSQVIWLTSQAGTGKWEEYIRWVYCGDSGTFSSGGHVYVSGPAGALTFYLASCNAYELHSAPATTSASPMRWFYESAVATTDKQPAYRVDRTTVVRATRHQSQTPGTGTIMIKVNGSNQWSITLSGADSSTGWTTDNAGPYLGVLNVGDSVTISVTGGGTAAGVTVQLELEAALWSY